MRAITGVAVATAAAAALAAGTIASANAGTTGTSNTRASVGQSAGNADSTAPTSENRTWTSSDGTVHTAAGQTLPTCTLNRLRITLDNGGVEPGTRNGMNHAGTYLRMRNVGSGTCVLRGYPGLGLETAGHRTARTDTQWGSTAYVEDPGRTSIVVEPGDSAWSDMSWTHSDSNAVDASYLEVTPPASTVHATLPFEQVVDNGTLHVTALADSPPPIR